MTRVAILLASASLIVAVPAWGAEPEIGPGVTRPAFLPPDILN